MTNKIINEDIDHKILADHFGKTAEAFRQLKRKWEEDRAGLWPIYVRAYNFDQIHSLKARALDKDITINSNARGVAWFNDTYYYADDELSAVIKACGAINE